MNKPNFCARAVFAFVFAASAAAAEEKTLSGGEIDSLLSGNTAHGVHYGKRTTQYFSESGLTLWRGENDGKPSEGEWKTEGGKYCSRFADFGGKWGCYEIRLDEAQGVHYFTGENFRAPFVVREGYSVF